MTGRDVTGRFNIADMDGVAYAFAKTVDTDVNGDIIPGDTQKDHMFLYQLDRSILPADRAYPTVTDWTGTDQLDTEHDRYTGQWAVYATRDLYRDRTVIAQAGERIAGSDFDGSTFGGDEAEDDDDAGQTAGTVDIDGTVLCEDTIVTSNTDDWNGYRAKPLASTGAAVTVAALIGLGLIAAGDG